MNEYHTPLQNDQSARPLRCPSSDTYTQKSSQLEHGTVGLGQFGQTHPALALSELEQMSYSSVRTTIKMTLRVIRTCKNRRGRWPRKVVEVVRSEELVEYSPYCIKRGQGQNSGDVARHSSCSESTGDRRGLDDNIPSRKCCGVLAESAVRG